eukprot:1153510-Pelagomonas_calceolata.AAC.2
MPPLLAASSRENRLFQLFTLTKFKFYRVLGAFCVAAPPPCQRPLRRLERTHRAPLKSKILKP